MKKLLLFNIFFLAFLCLNAQVTFEKTFNYFTMGEADAVFCQEDGYLMPVTSGISSLKLTLVKTNLNGDTLWTRTYDYGIDGSDLIAATDDPEGNIYLCYFNKIIKFDKNGNQLWVNDIYPMQDIIYRNNALWTSTYSYISKFDPLTGDSLWQSDLFPQESPVNNMIENTCLAMTDNGDLVYSVLYHNYATHDLHSVLYKVSPITGEFDTINLQTEEPPVIADLMTSGNEIIGVARGSRMYSNSFSFIRFTADGTVTAMKKHTYQGLYDWRPYRCILNNENNVVVLGRAMGFTPDTRIMLHCLSMTGDSLWSATTGRPYATGYDIKLTPDNGYIIAGKYSISVNSSRPHLIKTTSQGVINAFEEKTTPNSVKHIYPNPASDHVVFELQGAETGVITIHNSTGGLCAQIPFSGKRVVYDTQSLKPGLYFYKVAGSSGGVFVVNR